MDGGGTKERMEVDNGDNTRELQGNATVAGLEAKVAELEQEKKDVKAKLEGLEELISNIVDQKNVAAAQAYFEDLGFKAKRGCNTWKCDELSHEN